MKTFEQRIKQIKAKRIGAAIFILMIATVLLIFGIIEILPKEINYIEFRNDKKLSNYSKATIYYITGPLIEIRDTKDETTSGYYIAFGEDEKLFIIRLNSDNIQIPILGKDVDEESIDELEGVQVYGSAQLTSSNLKSILIRKLNILFNEDITNNENFEKVFGAYNLDTVLEIKNNGTNLIILSSFFAIIGFIYLLINKRIKVNVEQCINYLKSKGELEKVIKEFDNGQLINYKKLNVDLSSNYIFSYSVGLDVILFKDIKEVNVSKKTIGSRNKNKYIIVTTKDNVEHYIAPIQKKKQKAIFNELLTKIKRTIE